jgi:hypothetical protein
MATNFLSESLPMLRANIDDMDSCDYEYSDERLAQLLFIAADYVNIDMCWSYNICVSAQTISPDPACPNKDGKFLHLVILKASQIFYKSLQSSYSVGGFKLTDGPTAIDLTGNTVNLKTISDDYLAQYNRLKQSILFCSGGYGIITPYGGSN